MKTVFLRRLFLFALCFFLFSSVHARAQSLSSQDLEKKIQKTAKASTPRTVLITVHVNVGGQMKKGYGSGALISADGYILTCSHVTEMGEQIEVTLSDGKVYSAKKLGYNAKQDYSMIKIDAKSLPYFSIGDSKSLKVGDWVVALGHPGGPYADKKPAVCSGTITGLEKTLVLGGNNKFYNHAIRTDAPIYMGNSGGPLVDLEGKLIGINGAIIMLNQNSYSIPIHQIMADEATLKAGTRLAGVTPSFLDMQAMRKEISPQDMEHIYKKLAENFYDETLGKALKYVKKWWNTLFPKKQKQE